MNNYLKDISEFFKLSGLNIYHPIVKSFIIFNNETINQDIFVNLKQEDKYPVETFR